MMFSFSAKFTKEIEQNSCKSGNAQIKINNQFSASTAQD